MYACIQSVFFSSFLIFFFLTRKKQKREDEILSISVNDDGEKKLRAFLNSLIVYFLFLLLILYLSYYCKVNISFLLDVKENIKEVKENVVKY